MAEPPKKKMRAGDPPPPELLTGEKRDAALGSLHGDWRVIEGRDAIQRRLKFRTFQDAWTAMSSIARAAEAQNHHPEWSNVYNRVDVVLTTHDSEGVTERDIALAASIDRIAAAVKSKAGPSEGAEGNAEQMELAALRGALFPPAPA